MSQSELEQERGEKDADISHIAERVIDDPTLLNDVLSGLSAKKPRIKYGCEKVLRRISEKNPVMLYPWFEYLAGLLESENNFLRWGAINTLANLAVVDSENKFEDIFEKYFAPIRGLQLIAAANAIGGAAKLGKAKPHLIDRISKELLKVEKAKYQTAECRNIALGKVISSFDILYDGITDKEPVNQLVRRQLNNTRNSTKKKAERFARRRLS